MEKQMISRENTKYRATIGVSTILVALFSAIIFLLPLFGPELGMVYAQDSGVSAPSPRGLDAWDRKYRPFDHDDETDDANVINRGNLLKRWSRDRSRKTWQRHRMLQMIDPGYSYRGKGSEFSAPTLRLNPMTILP